jgi:hypothetical protein
MNKQKKLLIVFYINNVQVLYYKRDKRVAKEFVAGLKRVYKLRELGLVK